MFSPPILFVMCIFNCSALRPHVTEEICNTAIFPSFVISLYCIAKELRMEISFAMILFTLCMYIKILVNSSTKSCKVNFCLLKNSRMQ